MGRPAATAAAGQTQHAIHLVLWVCGKTTGAFVKCPLTVVAGAAFFDDMTLNDYDIVFDFQIYHISNFLLSFVSVNRTIIFELKVIRGDLIYNLADSKRCRRGR
jgi:hypothetical protein